MVWSSRCSSVDKINRVSLARECHNAIEFCSDPIIHFTTILAQADSMQSAHKYTLLSENYWQNLIPRNYIVSNEYDNSKLQRKRAFIAYIY